MVLDLATVKLAREAFFAAQGNNTAWVEHDKDFWVSVSEQLLAMPSNRKDFAPKTYEGQKHLYPSWQAMREYLLSVLRHPEQTELF